MAAVMASKIQDKKDSDGVIARRFTFFGKESATFIFLLGFFPSETVSAEVVVDL